MRASILNLMALVAILTGGFPLPTDAKDADRKADSLKTLQIIIRGELKPGNQVLILKEKGFSDSVVRSPRFRERTRFDRLIGDSTVAAEVRTRQEFHGYWRKVEEENGYGALRGQYDAQDLDRSRIPKTYLFDSSVVVYPGWIVIRRK